MDDSWTEPRHRHGGHPHEDAQRLNVNPGEVTDFSVNTAPTGPPDDLLNRRSELMQDIDRYPDRHGSGIRRFISNQLDVPRNHVLGGNGVSELLYLVLRCLRPEQTTLLTPSFHDYRRAAEAAGSTVSPLPISLPQPEARLDLPNLANNTTGSNLLMVGNPNNPTGTVLPPDRIRSLAEQNPDRWVLVDEAFIRFTDHPSRLSVAKDVPQQDNLIVFRSLTKFYTIPGLRAGAAIASPSVLNKLSKHRAPWMVNSIADRAAEVLNETDEYDHSLRSLICSERSRLSQKYKNVKSLEIQPSEANFFLARWTGTDQLDDLLKHLLRNDLYVRDARNFRGLNGNWFRFAIRTKPENNRLFNAIQNSSEKV